MFYCSAGTLNSLLNSMKPLTTVEWKFSHRLSWSYLAVECIIRLIFFFFVGVVEPKISIENIDKTIALDSTVTEITFVYLKFCYNMQYSNCLSFHRISFWKHRIVLAFIILFSFNELNKKIKFISDLNFDGYKTLTFSCSLFIIHSMVDPTDYARIHHSSS